MRFVVAGALALALIGPAPAAETGAAQPASCSIALSELGDRWDAAGFPMPAKPSQMVVVGRNGQRASATQINYMRGQIALAAQECADGREAAALQRISAVANLLGGRETVQAAQ
jgi:hypothetical protein